MPKQLWIVDQGGTIIDLGECEIVEIEVEEDEDFDVTEERINDGEGDRFGIVKGDKIA
jgi:hypothetical protein